VADTDNASRALQPEGSKQDKRGRACDVCKQTRDKKFDREKPFYQCPKCGRRTYNEMADTAIEGLERESIGKAREFQFTKGSEKVSDTAIEGLEGKEPEGSRSGKSGLPAECGWWTTEPSICGMANGIPDELDGYQGRLSCKSFHRADKLRGLGNAIVPVIAMKLFQLIKSRL
jgi:hypothetical protein